MSGKTITHSFTTTTTLGRGGIGLYGKVPSLGDFISRRLPKMFIADWDAWLQHSLLISREKLGDRWLDLYLGMPMWRFCVGPGILSGEMWMGVLVPSVDRVGRYFPLTIAASLPENTDMAATFSSSSVWFENVEAAALELLKPSASFEKIDPALAALPQPCSNASPVRCRATTCTATGCSPTSTRRACVATTTRSSASTATAPTPRGMPATPS